MRDGLTRSVLTTIDPLDQAPSQYFLYTASVGEVPGQVLAVHDIGFEGGPDGIVFAVDENEQMIVQFPTCIPWMLIRRNLIEMQSRGDFMRNQMEEHKLFQTLKEEAYPLLTVSPPPSPLDEVGGQYL